MSDIKEEQKRLYKRAEENDIKLLKEELEYQKQAEIEYNEKHLKLMNMYSDLKSRNEKAIEYIKEDMYVEPKELYGLVDGEHLLNILKGDNK